MQPLTRLQRNRTLPCKVVITSTHAIPHVLEGFLMVKVLLLVSISHNSQSLKDYLMCTMKVWVHLTNLSTKVENKQRQTIMHQAEQG